MSNKVSKHTKLIAAPKNGKVVSREAPEERSVARYTDFKNAIVNEAQVEILYGKTPEHAIRTRPGKGGKEFKYIPHGYITDRLNKAFGFAWSFQLMPVVGNDKFVLQVYDEETARNSKQVRDISVYGELTANVYNPKTGEIISITKGGPGSQRWEMGTEFGDAFKGAESDALKRCAMYFGVALDLYYDDDAAIEQHEARQRQAEELQAEMEAMQAPAWMDKAKALRAEGKSSKAIADALNVTMAEVNKWAKE